MDSVDSNEISINSNPTEINKNPPSSTPPVTPQQIISDKLSKKQRSSNKTCSIS